MSGLARHYHPTGFMSTGTASGAAGIYLNDAAPGTSTATLYNSGGNLYWAGSQLATAAAAGGWSTGTGTIYTTTLTNNVGVGTSAPVATVDVMKPGRHHS